MSTVFAPFRTVSCKIHIHSIKGTFLRIYPPRELERAAALSNFNRPVGCATPFGPVAATPGKSFGIARASRPQGASLLAAACTAEEVLFANSLAKSSRFATEWLILSHSPLERVAVAGELASPSTTRHISFWPLMRSTNFRFSFSAALRQSSMRSRKISK